MTVDLFNSFSGGPLVISGTKTQVGIVSFGVKECDSPVIPGVYARVASVVAWIKYVAGV
jgi:trypsin